MARYTPEHKEQTRQQIVEAASRLFRKQGVHSTRVEDVMAELGLTVGGFYRHYDSKEALLCDALSMAMTDSREIIAHAKPELTGSKYLEAASKIYLSDAHRENVSNGCALPGLTADVARSSDQVREHFENEICTTIQETMGRLEGTEEERERQAWQLTALNLGGLLISRAVKDPALAHSILERCRRTEPEYVEND